MRRLAVLGASGHGKVVADAALRAGWREVAFFDDGWPQFRQLGPWSVVGGTTELLRNGGDFDGVVVAIGDNRTRLRKQRELVAGGLTITTVVHPCAVVSPYASVGDGSVVFAGAIINAFAVIGIAGIVNTGATVDHDCMLADGVHVSPGAHLGGGVMVGEAAWIGIGSSIRHGISIGANAIVGAGAAVVKDVAADLVAVGVPARALKAREEQ